MVYKKVALALLSCCALLCACGRAVLPDYSITASPSVIEMAPAGNEPAVVSVSSSREWYVINKAEWLSVVETEGGFTVTVTDNVAAGNELAKERSAELVVSNSARSARVKIHQAGDPVPVSACIPGAMWEITSSYASSCSKAWVEDNVFPANAGVASGAAYISTTGNGRRVLDGNNIAATDLSEGDAFQFVWPSVDVKAGTDIDFMTCLFSTGASVPKYWVFEYEQDGQWHAVETDLKTAPEDDSLKYSFRMFSNNSQYTSFVQSFTLTSDLKGDLKLRCRAVGSLNAAGGPLTPGGSSVGFVNSRWRGACINIYGDLKASGKVRLLEIGNSFTYYYAGNYMLKEIARSQGLQIDMRTFCKGGQYIRDHASLDLALDAVNEGGYDYAILQDQSAQQALYCSDTVANRNVLEDTRKFMSSIKAASPSVRIILEAIQSFPTNEYEGYGSFDRFDWFQRHGADLLSQRAGCSLSPVGLAFRKARQEGMDDLYYSDGRHPNRNGAYLKACVNCLVLTGKPFDSNAPDCLVESGIASRLRKVAEDVVLGGWRDAMFLVDEPDNVNFDAFGGTGHATVHSDVDFTVSSSETWLTVDVSGDVVSWSVDENESSQARHATITLSPDGLPQHVIQIEQSALDVVGGINSAEELVEFATLVNSGQDYSRFCNASGEVALNRDIDMSGVSSWVPIGLPGTALTLKYDAAPDPGATAFKGKFNGNGHKISRLSMSADISKTQFAGLFAALSGAIVKNLVLDDAVLTVSGETIVTGHAVAGLVVAYSLNSSIENVRVTGRVTGSACSMNSQNVSVGGICGYAGLGGKITGCTMDGTIDLSVETKYSNGNTVNIAGVLGACIDYGTARISIQNCTNNATVDVRGHRAGGVVAAVYRANIESCTNNGTIHCNYAPGAISIRKTTVTGVRIGGVMGYCSHQTKLADIRSCLNTGCVRTEEPESVAGGTIGLIRCMSVSACFNSGNVICPDNCFGRGLLVGCLSTATNPSVFSQCKLKGSIGASEDSLVPATKSNYLDAGIGISYYSTASAETWSQEEIFFWE